METCETSQILSNFDRVWLSVGLRRVSASGLSSIRTLEVRDSVVTYLGALITTVPSFQIRSVSTLECEIKNSNAMLAWLRSLVLVELRQLPRENRASCPVPQPQGQHRDRPTNSVFVSFRSIEYGSGLL